MRDQVVLVDFENVQKFDLTRLPANTRIKIFVGAQQARLPTALVLQAQAQAKALGLATEWIQIDGSGANALDFHIACHLGEDLSRTPQAEFVIVSRDTGFDPLLRHLKARGLYCRRDAPAAPAKSPPTVRLDTNTKQVIELLCQMEKNKRPRKRETLTNHLVNHFKKRISPEQVTQSINQMLKAKLLSGTDAALVYQF